MPNVIATIDTTKFVAVMEELYDAMVGYGDGQQAGLAVTLVEDESRRLIRQIVRFLPPQNQKQGENAVARDLRGLISEAPQAMIDSVRFAKGARGGTTNIDTFFTRKDGVKRRLVWDNMLPNANRGALGMLHNQYRDNRGRVKSDKARKGDRGGDTWSARVVVPNGTLKGFIIDNQRKVGRAKAAWCKLAQRLGLKVEPWVARQLPSPNAIGDASGMAEGKFPTISFGSRQAGVGAYQPQIADAVQVRAEAMRRRVRLVLSDFNKELAQNMKLRTKEKKAAYDAEQPSNEYGSSGITY